MPTSPDGSASLKMLLLKAQPGSLEVVFTAWPHAEILARGVDQGQGVTDRISREKVHVVFCDLTGNDCPGPGVLKPICRVHPKLPLVAVVPDQDFAMALAAFRRSADDLLAQPLSNDVLLATWSHVSYREQLDARQMKGEIFLEPVEEEGTSIGLLLPSRETSMELTYD